MPRKSVAVERRTDGGFTGCSALAEQRPRRERALVAREAVDGFHASADSRDPEAPFFVTKLLIPSYES